LDDRLLCNLYALFSTHTLNFFVLILAMLATYRTKF